MIPLWLHTLSIAYLSLGFACALWIALDVIRHPQHMWVMNLVWPLVALFATLGALWGYYRFGRLATAERAAYAKAQGRELPSTTRTPLWAMVGKGAAHCGSGCCLGDIIAEWVAFLFPAVAVWFGFHSVFPDKIFAVWVLDYLLAFTIGILFQYFTIAPMRGLGVREGIIAAVKADVLSLTAWQVGMYGFMAIAHFYLFGHLLGVTLTTNSTEFWFMMQLAMVVGFLTSYPVNWWLIAKGLKEKM